MTVFKKYNGSDWEAIAVGQKGDSGVGVPTGGTTDQVLAKVSATDYDTAWVTLNYVDAAGAVSAIKADPDWNATDWDTAYGWGDHAVAGYLTSFTETDPTVPSHVKSITTGDINNWDAAFGWGDHASEGYLTTESDPVVGAVTGIVKADGAGNISAAVADTDYQSPLTGGTDYLEPSSIDVTVQGYDADTAKYDDTTANFTGTLQEGGNNVVTSNEIGTIASQDANSVNIDGGAIDGTAIGANSASTGKFSSLTLTGEIDEQVFALSGTTPALDPGNGTIQTWTLSGNSTPTATNFLEGESILLLVDDGTAYTITWPTMEWIGGSAPTLDTANTNVIELWKVGSTLYGALVGVSS